jgi:hypothetical protein
VTIDPCERWCEGMLMDRAGSRGRDVAHAAGRPVVTQKFQKFTGTLARQPLEGRLRGEEITFTTGTATYRGRVHGDDLHVSATVDGKTDRVARAARPGWGNAFSRQAVLDRRFASQLGFTFRPARVLREPIHEPADRTDSVYCPPRQPCTPRVAHTSAAAWPHLREFFPLQQQQKPERSEHIDVKPAEESRPHS